MREKERERERERESEKVYVCKFIYVNNEINENIDYNSFKNKYNMYSETNIF